MSRPTFDQDGIQYAALDQDGIQYAALDLDKFLRRHFVTPALVAEFKDLLVAYQRETASAWADHLDACVDYALAEAARGKATWRKCVYCAGCCHWDGRAWWVCGQCESGLDESDHPKYAAPGGAL